MIKKFSKIAFLILFLSIGFSFNNKSSLEKNSTTNPTTNQKKFSKVTLFEWDNMSYGLFNTTRNNATFKYFPRFQTQPMLMMFEAGQKIRRGGTSKVDLNFEGNKTVLKHTPTSGYSELELPNRMGYKGNLTYWSVLTIDMNFTKDTKRYKVPLQLRLNMSNNSKTELTLKPSGNVLFTGLDKNGSKTSFWTKKTFDTNKRFKIQFRFSNKGDYVVYLNDKEWFSDKIDPKYFNNGRSNRVWFEGETEIYHLSLQEWLPTSLASIQFGLNDAELDNYNSQIASFFKNIDTYYDGIGFIIENGKPKTKMSIKSNSFRLKSYEQVAIRREFFPEGKGSKSGTWGYRVALYLEGSVQTKNGRRENITLPIVYQFLDPNETSHDDVSIYLIGMQNAYPTSWKFVRSMIGY